MDYARTILQDELGLRRHSRRATPRHPRQVRHLEGVIDFQAAHWDDDDAGAVSFTILVSQVICISAHTQDVCHTDLL